MTITHDGDELIKKIDNDDFLTEGYKVMSALCDVTIEQLKELGLKHTTLTNEHNDALMLLEDVKEVLNEIPNTKVNNKRFKSTYELCSYISKCLK